MSIFLFKLLPFCPVGETQIAVPTLDENDELALKEPVEPVLIVLKRLLPKPILTGADWRFVIL